MLDEFLCFSAVILSRHLNQFQPFIRHEIRIPELIQSDRWLIVQRGMPSQKVEEGNVEDHIGVCLFKRAIAIGWIVVLLERPVKAFFCLFEGTVLL